MSSKTLSGRCIATTKAGQPCRAFARHDSQYCVAHAPPQDNQDPLASGFSAQLSKPLVTIDDIIEALGQHLAYSSQLLANTEDLKTWIKIFRVHAQALSRQGRLLRDRQALSDDSADSFEEIIGQALDQISEELGLPL